MNRENSNATAKIDNISTKHVEINEKFLKRYFETACKKWYFIRQDSINNILLAAIRDARNCKSNGAFKRRLQPSYTVPPKPKPRMSFIRQNTAVSGRESVENPTTSSPITHHTSQRPQSSQSRPQTPQMSQGRPQTPYKSSKTSLWDPQTPHTAHPEQLSSRQDASETPNAFLRISRLQQGVVPTSTPFKAGTSQNKPEMTFNVVLPSKHNQSQVRKIQCDQNLSIDDYEMIVDIVESFTDVHNLSNSLIQVSKRNLSQIAPGRYELLRAI